MDIRTLTLVNLIFLFLYAAMMLVNSGIYGDVRGGRWFIWSNVSRGAALMLLTLGTTLPKGFATVLGDVLLVVGLMLLHRSLAEVLGRGKTAWRIHVGLTIAVFAGVSFYTFVHDSSTTSLMLVSVALAVQMALTASLLFSNTSRTVRMAAMFLGSILFCYATAYMVRAVALYRHGGAGALEWGPGAHSMLIVLLLLGSLLANGGTAFGFMFLSAAQLRHELTRQAERDALTGLLNRRGLKALADRSLTKDRRRAGEPLSAVMLDLDGMKIANDTWGHECGDEMLCTVAKLLVRTVGQQGAVARLGGDEFLVMLPGMAQGSAVEFAEHLRASIENLRMPRCRPRASFGVASLTGVKWEEAVRQSDQALNRAKNAGKNRVMCFG